MKILATLVAGLLCLKTWADTTGIIPFSETELVVKKNYLMDTYKDSKYSKDAVNCMVKNLYHEARGEGFAGMYAVAMVVMNRVQDKRYPNTVCGVVQQGPLNARGLPKKHRCQFSWYCDGKSDKMHDPDAFFDALAVTELVFLGSEKHSRNRVLIVDITEGATHYHTVNVKPKWRNDKGMTLIGRFGEHLFYRWG